jgi:hypothetical protein
LFLILDLTTKCGEWSASRPGSALPPGKDLWHPSDRRQGGRKSWFALPLPGIEPRSCTLQSDTLLTELCTDFLRVVALSRHKEGRITRIVGEVQKGAPPLSDSDRVATELTENINLQLPLLQRNRCGYSLGGWFTLMRRYRSTARR